MRFGTEHLTTTLDDNGSTIRVSRKVHDYKVISSKKRYEIRAKVSNEKEELEEFLKFQADKIGKLDPEFRIETTQAGKDMGHYYVVKCWTVLGDE